LKNTILLSVSGQSIAHLYIHRCAHIVFLADWDVIELVGVH